MPKSLSKADAYRLGQEVAIQDAKEDKRRSRLAMVPEQDKWRIITLNSDGTWNNGRSFNSSAVAARFIEGYQSLDESKRRAILTRYCELKQSALASCMEQALREVMYSE